MPPVFQRTRSAIFTTPSSSCLLMPMVVPCPLSLVQVSQWMPFWQMFSPSRIFQRSSIASSIVHGFLSPPKPLSCVTKWAREQFLLPEASKKWSEADHTTTIIYTNTNTGQRSSLGSGLVHPKPPTPKWPEGPTITLIHRRPAAGDLNGRRRKRQRRPSVLKLNHSAAGKL